MTLIARRKKMNDSVTICCCKSTACTVTHDTNTANKGRSTSKRNSRMKLQVTKEHWFGFALGLGIGVACIAHGIQQAKAAPAIETSSQHEEALCVTDLECEELDARLDRLGWAWRER